MLLRLQLFLISSRCHMVYLDLSVRREWEKLLFSTKTKDKLISSALVSLEKLSQSSMSDPPHLKSLTAIRVNPGTNQYSFFHLGGVFKL